MSVTTEQLLALAKEGADLTNVSDYVTDAIWLSWLNDGVKELHRLVTNKFRATYYRTYDFTVAEGDSLVTLPSNFWRLKGLDLNPDQTNRRAVLPFNFAERNDYRRDYTRDFGPVSFSADRYYNVLTRRRLQLQPKDHASGTYRLYYTPKPHLLALARTFNVNSADTTVPTGTTEYGRWAMANGAFVAADIGGTLTPTFGAPNTAFNTDYEVVSIASTTAVNVTPDPTTLGTFTNPASGTVSLVHRLDEELEDYSEYVWASASIKSLNKEESYAQIKRLDAQLGVIRNDLAESLETDQGGPATIIDTDGDDW